MSKREMTPWFPASTPPDRVGVYEVKGRMVPMYSRWDGENWLHISKSLEKASIQKWVSVVMYSTKDSAFWRGFTNEQK